MPYVLGIDIGTGSTKAVGVDADGTVRATALRQHEISRPRPGRAEHDPGVWWAEVKSVCQELIGQLGGTPAAVCVSGMGPCLAPTDAGG
jgi:xylulokinase